MNDHDRHVLVAQIRGDAYSHVWAIREEYEGVLRALGRGEVSADLVERLEARARPSSGIEAVGGVATIGLKGTISPTPSLLSLLFGLDDEPVLEKFGRELNSAARDPEVKAIVMDVNSPGGVISGVPEMAREIRAVRRTKPIVAVANDMAGSAAYWLASQASEISADVTADVGSIGVFKLHDDISAMDEMRGIKTTLIKAGRYKAEMLPYFPLSDEAVAYQQAQVDDVYGMFVSDVAKGRRTTPGVVKADYGEGRMVFAKEAKKAGMIDRVESLASAQQRMRNASPTQLSEMAASSADLDARWDEEILSQDKAAAVTLTVQDRYALLDGLLA
jgi:signal peptide peptidase SppA